MFRRRRHRDDHGDQSANGGIDSPWRKKVLALRDDQGQRSGKRNEASQASVTSAGMWWEPPAMGFKRSRLIDLLAFAVANEKRQKRVKAKTGRV